MTTLCPSYLHLHLSLNREGPWDTIDDFTTSFLHFSLFSTALWNFTNSRSVHFLMLSSHLFFCLSRLLPPFTVLCEMVLARAEERKTIVIPPQFAPLHDGQVFVWSDCLLDLGTDFLVGNKVFCMRCIVSCCSPSFPWLILLFAALL